VLHMQHRSDCRAVKSVLETYIFFFYVKPGKNQEVKISLVSSFHTKNLKKSRQVMPADRGIPLLQLQ